MQRAVSLCIVCLVTMCLTLTGCGESGDTSPVTGKVTFADGAPLTRGTITFHSVEGHTSATGEIDSDGTFFLTSVEEGDGASPGKYQVTIVALEPGSDEVLAPEDALPDAGEPAQEKAKPLVDPKFGQPSTSGLEVEVKDQANEFNFEVTAPSEG